MIEAAIEEAYERFGRHLIDISEVPIIMGPKKYQISEGVCARTGIAGPVVHYEESHGGGKIPTNPKVLWVFPSHGFVNQTEEPVQKRLGGKGNCLLVIPRHGSAFTNLRLQKNIPDLDYVSTEGEILRRITALSDYLFFGFCESTPKIFDNGFRRSYNTLEVNGELTLHSQSNTKITNASLSLDDGYTLSQSQIDYKLLKKLYYYLNLTEQTERDFAELQKLAEGIPIEILRILHKCEWKDIYIAGRLMS